VNQDMDEMRNKEHENLLQTVDPEHKLNNDPNTLTESDIANIQKLVDITKLDYAECKKT